MIFKSKLPAVGTTIFSVMSKLASTHGAINLSQGFPDYPVDKNLVEEISKAMNEGFNQYAPMPGLLNLRAEIARKMEKFYGKAYDPESEITVTAGGTQAIFTAINTFVHPQDEVIIFEPAYDCYTPTIQLAGGIVKPYELSAPHYSIDWHAVKDLVTDKTRIIIINNPHNPTGKILSLYDLQMLQQITSNTNIIILSDEVYEHIIYDNEPHLSVAKFPELAKRSIIVASFGKLLHATGWKVGYAIAPEILMNEFRKVHQFNVFSVNTAVQNGIANYLKQTDIYNQLPIFFQQKRDYFRNMMAQTRFELLPCQGTYFQTVSYKNISDSNDVSFAKSLVQDFGVAAIPISAFYTKNNDFNVLRFCFAKENSTLEQAVEKLIKR